MSQFVDIPVKCISEGCKNCEDLEIEIDRLCGYGANLQIFTQNTCYCKHYRRCERLMKELRKNSIGDNEKDGV